MKAEMFSFSTSSLQPPTKEKNDQKDSYSVHYPDIALQLCHEYDRSGIRYLSELTVDVLDGVRGIDSFSQPEDTEEGSEIFPSCLPALEVCRIHAASDLPSLERLSPASSRLERYRRVSILHRSFPVLGGDEHDGMPDLMNDADLYIGVRVHCLDGFREALEPSTQAMSMSSTPRSSDRSALHPELRSFRFAYPDAEHLFLSVLVDASAM